MPHARHPPPAARGGARRGSPARPRTASCPVPALPGSGPDPGSIPRPRPNTHEHHRVSCCDGHKDIAHRSFSPGGPAPRMVASCRRAAPRQKALPPGGRKPKALRGGLFCRRAPRPRLHPTHSRPS
ncbi:hypothetical protein BN940_10091 [Castellaniella defragrans 65Phen]|uniref:Uncharacterized protein n=1 Tax=Castellaniella defragrans (strain DSM 12143 / CCUG 39792 / 65Phen) TaxID=1437824 RepID=W8WXI7_CASD6|nr:hypothetical protein BN940_10091 [Castellaniella defragrans 65Phen]